MEILNSGSFVPLDNREKIEQLIFTAKTLATEVSRAEGFQSSGQTNHQIGLEMWKGAEYMCRAHEEATVRNLFLSKFLESLREIERQSAVQPSPDQTEVIDVPTGRTPVEGQMQVVATPPTQPVPISIPVAPSPEIVPDSHAPETRDEYLGVISQALEIDNGRSSYADECKPEFEREFAETNNALKTEEVIPANEESNKGEPRETTASETPQAGGPPAIARNDTDLSAPGIKREPAGEEVSTAEPPISDIGVTSIVLSEKEPYNFDSCTVTAVIQLLPESGGIRKSVISIRSHDFAPQISISDASNSDVLQSIKQYLDTALGQYRTHLPVLAAEKIKKQKPASKKRSTKTVDKAATAGAVSEVKTSDDLTVSPAAQNSEAAKDQQNLFAS
ncbi:MAG: hypothetical protein ACRD6X_04435 [Pyrinomonadaceae bacterium]